MMPWNKARAFEASGVVKRLGTQRRWGNLFFWGKWIKASQNLQLEQVATVRDSLVYPYVPSLLAMID